MRKSLFTSALIVNLLTIATGARADGFGTLVCEVASGGYGTHMKIETRFLDNQQLTLADVADFSIKDFQTGRFQPKGTLSIQQTEATNSEAYRFHMLDTLNAFPEKELTLAVEKSNDNWMKVRIFGKGKNVELGSGVCQL